MPIMKNLFRPSRTNPSDSDGIKFSVADFRSMDLLRRIEREVGNRSLDNVFDQVPEYTFHGESEIGFDLIADQLFESGITLPESLADHLLSRTSDSDDPETLEKFRKALTKK